MHSFSRCAGSHSIRALGIRSSLGSHTALGGGNPSPFQKRKQRLRDEKCPVPYSTAWGGEGGASGKNSNPL